MLCHKASLLKHSQPSERALLRSACALGGHEWTDAVPSHEDFRVPAVMWVPAFRHFLGLPTFPGEHPPLACRCKLGDGTPPWAHALSCNLGGAANKKHNRLARAWFAFLRLCGAAVSVCYLLCGLVHRGDQHGEPLPYGGRRGIHRVPLPPASTAPVLR